MKKTVGVLIALSVWVPVLAGAADQGGSKTSTDQQGAMQPGATQPSGTQPSASQPSASQPSASQPSGTQPSATQSQSQSAQSAAGGMVETIDCPPAAVAKAQESLPSKSPVGTPSGTGSGSGAQALPGSGQTQRVEGQIAKIDSSRTSRAIEIGDVKVWVEPSTPVLVDCQMASLADLKEGTSVKAAYEEKGGRKVATIVEATKEKKQ